MALVCTIELNKAEGVSVHVFDSQQNLKQTIVLDGETITTVVANDSASTTLVQKVDAFVRRVDASGRSSVMTQTASSVVFECDHFEVQASTIETRSSSETTVSSDGTVALSSTGAFSVDSGDTAEMSAVRDLRVSSDANLTATGGLSATLGGTQRTTLGEDTAAVCVRGRSVDVEAGTTLSAKAEISAEVQGATATIEGKSAVAIRGSTIALG